MTTWGVVATVKAPEEQVLAFIAHHLALGASGVWIYFDDPADPVHARISRLPRVKAVRCTGWYWAMRGGRPESLDKRQIVNACHAQRRCRLDWLAHIDADEFIHAPGPVADFLAQAPSDAPNVMMAPFEALHDPGLPDDIYTARHFRGPLGKAHPELHQAIFGPMSDIVAKGNLGHVIGKSFCRIGFPGAKIGLHSVFLNGDRLRGPIHPQLRVLHFHAQDPEIWRRQLPYRLRNGGYRYDTENQLRSHLEGASDAKIDEFYQTVMTLTPEKAALLKAHDLLITADLGLRAKVAGLLAGRL